MCTTWSSFKNHKITTLEILYQPWGLPGTFCALVERTSIDTSLLFYTKLVLHSWGSAYNWEKRHSKSDWAADTYLKREGINAIEEVGRVVILSNLQHAQTCKYERDVRYTNDGEQMDKLCVLCYDSLRQVASKITKYFKLVKHSQ